MMTDEHSCMAEMNSACKTIFQQLKEKKKRGYGMFPAKNKTQVNFKEEKWQTAEGEEGRRHFIGEMSTKQQYSGGSEKKNGRLSSTEIRLVNM